MFDCLGSYISSNYTPSPIANGRQELAVRPQLSSVVGDQSF